MTTAVDKAAGSSGPLLLYLHGFLSAPGSQKAQQTRCYGERLGQRSLIPALHDGPARSMKKLRELVESRRGAGFMLVGSSLGGYYATFLAEEYGFPAVLINPAVRPWELWSGHEGSHRNYYTRRTHVVTREHIEELRELEKSPLKRPDNYRVYLQKGDATLDYRRALQKYGAQHCVVRENGSHSFDNYVSELPGIFDFLLSRIDHDKR